MKTISTNTINYIEIIKVDHESAFLYKINEDIYKLDMPPINSIFLIKNESEWYFVDAGKNSDDVDKFIVHAFSKLNIDFQMVKGILITHSHWDHIDGLSELLSLCPNATVYSYKHLDNYVDMQHFKSIDENYIIDNLFKVVTIFGHSDDSVGFIHTKTNTLFSGDAIQLYGISTCGMYVFNGVDRYISSLKKLQTVKIDNILASHPYVPNGAFAFGEKQSQKHISDSIACITELIEFTKGMITKGFTEIDTIRNRFIEQKLKQHPDFPTDGFDKAIESIINIYV